LVDNVYCFIAGCILDTAWYIPVIIFLVKF
jgi:hypothetical protein